MKAVKATQELYAIRLEALDLDHERKTALVESQSAGEREALEKQFNEERAANQKELDFWRELAESLQAESEVEGGIVTSPSEEARAHIREAVILIGGSVRGTSSVTVMTEPVLAPEDTSADDYRGINN